MLATTKQKQLEALKYWTFGKNVFPGAALLGISIVSGIVLLVRSYETGSSEDQVGSFLLLFLCPVLILYTLINVLRRYRQAVLIVQSIAPRMATLVWLDSWFHICLSLDQEKSTLIEGYTKRILFSLLNFEKFIWLFVRYCISGNDNEERMLSRQSKHILLYGPDISDKQKLVIIFIDSTPFFAKESFEICPERPAVSEGS